MTDPAIIEAAARAWKDAALSASSPLSAEEVLQVIVAAVTPLIEAAALERAAKAVEGFENNIAPEFSEPIAAAIRALKQEPLEEVAARVRNRPEAPEVT